MPILTPETVLIWVTYASARAMVTFRPKLLSRAISGSVVLLQMVSRLIVMLHNTSEAIGNTRVAIQDLCRADPSLQ